MKKLVIIFTSVVLILGMAGLVMAEGVPAIPEPDVMPEIVIEDVPAFPENYALPELDVLNKAELPGIIEGTGTHFAITDSEYLNVVLQSSAEIDLIMESVPEMVTLDISSAAGAASAEIILSGFNPLTTYYMYEDDYHNLTILVTDESGNYTYTQDLSAHHRVFIQPRKSTKFISDDATGGDCTQIGTWVLSTKTCTLTTDVGETIQIDSDGIILDGNGHTITGSNTGNGMYLDRRTGVTIKNLNIERFSYGINMYGGSGNTLTGNTVSQNRYFGYRLEYSHGNSITGSTLTDNNLGIYLSVSNNNTIINNIASNNDSSGLNMRYSDGNTITGNVMSDNGQGINMFSSDNNVITGNTASNNMQGITISGSGNTMTGNTAKENSSFDLYVSAGSDAHCNNVIENTTGSGDRPISYYNSPVTLQNETLSGLILCNADGSTLDNVTIEGSATADNNGLYVFMTDNSSFANITSSNNFDGILLYASNNNTLTGTTTSSNSRSGIYLHTSSGNALTGVTAQDNSMGISMDSSSGNALTDNTFSNNSTGIQMSSSSGNTLTGNIAQDNFYGIFMAFSSDNNNLNNNDASNNTYGIEHSYSGGNTLTGNTVKENNRYDIYFRANADAHCDNIIESTTGSGDRPIKYLSTSGSLQNETLAELILCNADGASIDNVTIEGSSAEQNNGLFVLQTDSASITNVDSSNNYYGMHMSTSRNNAVAGSTFSFNQSGITLSSSHDNALTGNTVLLNAIYLSGSSGNTLTSNVNSAHNHYNYGIHISNLSHNNTLQNNTTSNGYIGIMLSSNRGNTLIGNNSSDNYYGIYVQSSRENTISGNTASLNTRSGIFVYSSSHDNTLSGNTVSNNSSGITVRKADRVTITGNTMSDNSGTGLALDSSDSSTLTGNVVTNNSHGIYLKSSSGNAVFDNRVSQNSQSGIYLYSASGNDIYNNNFIDNGSFIVNYLKQAYTYNSTGNIFNLDAPTGGNYWSDFDMPEEGCDDVDNDNLCDAPYVFDYNQDSLPWTMANGWNDTDGDGVPDGEDVCPGGDDNVDSDGDFVPDFCDQCPDDPENDADGDGICESVDNCPLVVNASQANFDGDSMGDACDADDDNDGLTDEQEAAIGTDPYNTDTDNDSVGDAQDACPLEDATGLDADGNGCIDTISGLTDVLNTLVSEGVIEEQLVNSLLSKVENAEASVNKDNICAAINKFEALINEVNAQRGKKISNEAADLIILYTNNLIANLRDQLPEGDSC